MLVKTEKDRMAHIRKPGTEQTWCGLSINIAGSIRNCELCDHCLDVVGRLGRI